MNVNMVPEEKTQKQNVTNDKHITPRYAAEGRHYRMVINIKRNRGGRVMTHEQHAKKFLENLYLNTFGCVGNEERKEIDTFFHHLKEAIKKEMPKPIRCGCGPII
jgi:hypothetical protein